jgi:chemotaxis response regulator CheB
MSSRGAARHSRASPSQSGPRGYSLAEVQRERAMCIVLSGMGSDGTRLKEVKVAGGLVMVQQPETAQ